MMDPLPNINKVFSIVLHQEQNLSGATQVEDNILLTNIRQQNGKDQGLGEKRAGCRRGKNYGKQCSFCHKNEPYSRRILLQTWLPTMDKAKRKTRFQLYFSQ